jgi:aminomethyltransferase
MKTVLYDVHCSLGGTMVDFGGYDMPLWYPSGAVKEHLAVLNGAGIFDTSHMAVFLVEGKDVRKFLNYAVTKDISELAVGRAGYGIVLDSHGCAVDDTIVYPLSEERFGLVVNASMSAKVIEHLKTVPGGQDFTYIDLADKIAKLDLQGPQSVKIMRSLLADPDTVFSKLPYFSFKGDFDLSKSNIKLSDGTQVLLSRTGYTGELGFEIFLPLEKAKETWEKLLTVGKEFGVIPCGLAARDSLRAGAVLPLSHQDIGHWPFINVPWPWALPLAADGSYTKDFYGRKALEEVAKTADYTLPYVGFDPRKVDEHEAKVLSGDQEIGTILTVVADMAIGRVDGKIVGLGSPDKPAGWTPKGLVCGFVKVSKKLSSGTPIILKDNRRQLKAEIVSDIRPGRTARLPLK